MADRNVDHGAVSEIRTASGMPDDRCSRVFRVLDGVHLGESLAPAVLGEGWCVLAPQNSRWESAGRSALGRA